jgi:hypothetical protein
MFVLAMERSQGQAAVSAAPPLFAVDPVRSGARFPVTIAAESHPFPSRTRKLSLHAPMVLGGIPPGRVGRRRNISKQKAPRHWRGAFLRSGYAGTLMAAPPDGPRRDDATGGSRAGRDDRRGGGSTDRAGSTGRAGSGVGRQGRSDQSGRSSRGDGKGVRRTEGPRFERSEARAGGGRGGPPRSGAPRSGAPRSGAPRSGGSRSGAAWGGASRSGGSGDRTGRPSAGADRDWGHRGGSPAGPRSSWGEPRQPRSDAGGRRRPAPGDDTRRSFGGSGRSDGSRAGGSSRDTDWRSGGGRPERPGDRNSTSRRDAPTGSGRTSSPDRSGRPGGPGAYRGINAGGYQARPAPDGGPPGRGYGTARPRRDQQDGRTWSDRPAGTAGRGRPDSGDGRGGDRDRSQSRYGDSGDRRPSNDDRGGHRRPSGDDRRGERGDLRRDQPGQERPVRPTWGGRPGGFGDGAGIRSAQSRSGPPAGRVGRSDRGGPRPSRNDAPDRVGGPRRERRNGDQFGGRDADFERQRIDAEHRSGEHSPRSDTNPRRNDPEQPRWGSVARRGAAQVGREPTPDGPSASEVWRSTVGGRDANEVWEPEEVWVTDDEEAPTAPPPNRRPAPGGTQLRDQVVGEGSAPGGRRHTVPQPVVAELAAAAGVNKGARLAAKLADATHAYDRERYQEARRILRPLADEVPDAAAVRELHGLVLYRLGQWLPATRQLEAYRELTGSYDQHPVLADCYRALHRYADAEALWDDLRLASPDGDLVAEGRIVAAGCRSDQGDLPGAIALLEKTAKRVENPKDRHLRQWYALGDLYERAGDIPHARELFGRVARADPDAFDVRERLRAVR